MPQADGTIYIDSKLDTTGLADGLKKATSMAATGAAAIGAALATAAAAAIKIGADFQAGMSQVKAISGATEADMAKLTATAKEMGATTKFSAGESAEALKYMGMAGWDAEQMISGLPGIMNLAAASGESLASVSDIVTDSLTAMGLEAEDAAHFADVLAVASSASNTNVGMMGATFKYAAPLAGALGYSIEDLSVNIGLMANAGIKADQAGTALRALFTRLAKPTAESAAAMTILGLELTDGSGKMRSLHDVTVDMRKGFEGLTAAEKAQVAAMLGGQEAMSGLLAIVNAGDEDFESLTAAINDADGAAAAMAKTMSDNLQGDMEELGGALETVGIQIFEAFNTPMREAAQAATKAAGQLSKAFETPKMQDALGNIGDAIRGVIKAVAELAADAIPKLVDGIAWVVDNFGKLADGAKAVAIGFAVFKVAMSAASGLDLIAKASSAAAAANTVLAVSFAKTGTSAATGTAGLTVFQAAVGVMTGKITLATAATAAWNVVSAAAPWVLLAAGVAAVVYGVIALDKALSDTTEETKALSKEMDTLISSSRNLQKELSDSSQAFFDRGNAIAENAVQAEALVQELEALGSASALSSIEQARQKEIISDLNKLVPDLNLALDAQSKALNQTAAETRALIEAENARAEKADAEDRYKEKQEAQKKVISELAVLEAGRAMTLDALAEAQERVNTTSALFDPIDHAQANNDVKEHTKNLNELDLEIDLLTVDEAGLGVAVVRAAEDIQTANGKIAASDVNLAEIQEQKAAGIKSVTDAYGPLIEGTQKVIDATDALLESLGEEADAYEATSQAIEDEADLLRGLTAETEKLAGQTSRTAEEEARLAANVEMLNGYFPGLNLSIDEQTGALSATAEEISAYIDAWAGTEKAATSAERLTEIMKKQAATAGNLARTQDELAKSKKGLADSEREYLELDALGSGRSEEQQGKYLALGEIINEYGADVAKLIEQERLLGEEETALTQLYELAAVDRAAALAAIDLALEQGVITAEEAANRKKAILDKETADQEEADRRKEELSKKRVEAEKQLVAEMTATYERYASVTQNMFSVSDMGADISVAKMQKNMEINQANFAKYEQNMAELAEKVKQGILSESLYEEWDKIGFGAANAIDNANSASATALAGLSDTWDNGGKEAKDAMMSQLQSTGDAIVDQVIKGFSENPEIVAAAQVFIGKALEGMQSGTAGTGEGASDFTQVGKDMDTKAATALTDGTARALPDGAKKLVGTAKTDAMTEVTTQAFTEVGKQMDTDTATGTTDNTGLVTDAVDTAIGEARTTASSAVQNANFWGVGEQIPYGMAGGVRSGTGALVSAVQDMVAQALAATNKAQESRSPSRKFAEIGEYAVGGYLQPFETGEQKSRSIIGGYMDAMISEAQRQNEQSLGVRTTATGAAYGSAGDAISIGEVIVQAGPINSELDIAEVGRATSRAIGEEVSRAKRYKGVL